MSPKRAERAAIIRSMEGLRPAQPGVPIQKPTLVNRLYLWLAGIIGGKQNDDDKGGMGMGQ